MMSNYISPWQMAINLPSYFSFMVISVLWKQSRLLRVDNSVKRGDKQETLTSAASLGVFSDDPESEAVWSSSLPQPDGTASQLA